MPNFQNVVKAIYDFMVAVFTVFGEVWTFILQPITFGGIKLFGFTIIKPFEFSILYPTLSMITAIILVGIISLFNPFE